MTLPLAFSSTSSYPVMSPDGNYVYAQREKFDIANGALVRNNLSVTFDGRFATVYPNGTVALADSHYVRFYDMNTDTLLSQVPLSKQGVYWGSSKSSPSRLYAAITSFGSARGKVRLIEVNTGVTLYAETYLGDFTGEIVFTRDGTKALVGSGGNAWYGYGGVYVVDMNSFLRTEYIPNYGASALKEDRTRRIYTTSRYSVHSGRKRGNPAERGINIFEFSETGALEKVESYYLNTRFTNSSKPQFLIRESPEIEGPATLGL